MTVNLDTRRVTDLDAWQARIEARMAAQVRLRVLEQAAAVAAHTPRPKPKTARKPKPAAKKTPIERKPRVYTTKPDAEKVRPCTMCGHPTRSNRHLAADFPGTRPRRRGGLCTTCLPHAERPPLTNPRVDVAAIVAAYTPGVTINAVARQLGYHKDTVSRVLIAQGLRTKGGTR